MKRRRFLLPLILMLAALATAGCWDRREIVDVGIVMLTALDEGREPGTYRVHIHIAEPTRLGGAGQTPIGNPRVEPVTHIVTEGPDIDETRFEAERIVPRDIETSHRRVFIMGEPLARHGIKEVLDQISRNPKNRISTQLIIAEGSRAEELIDRKLPLENFGSEVLRELVLRKGQVPNTLRDYFIASTSPGQQPVAAGLTIVGNKISFNSVAIFQDHKLKGYIKGKQVPALIGLLGGRAGGSLTFRIPQVKGSLSAHLYQVKVRRMVAISKGEPIFTFRVTCQGRIMDNRTNLDLGAPGNVRKVEEAFTDELEQTYRSLFHRLQKEFQVDSVGLGAMIARRYPDFWKQIEKEWPTMYPNAKITWQVGGKITGIGSVGAPLYLPENEVRKD
ncbi:Ger(x)C family spore germination protein [Paenibacillus ginsengihumi]|uniref:Ger(x)C family spore germination protein n=1 Tax=Paenibacillus ginsengihumi TaxID=431596 RepID=UPI0003622CCB|nr:Ger(x)C family spore germination protein [Paenibacillus ginsengihumi]